MDVVGPIQNEEPPIDRAAQSPIHWRVVAASLPGTSHKRFNKPCQDANDWYVSPDGILIAAVADGAGSADLSQEGASTAARTAVAVLRAKLADQELPKDDKEWQTLLATTLEIARGSINAVAMHRKVDARQLATTLIIVVVAKETIAAAQVGDGAAVLRDSDGSIISLTAPQNGEYINEVTFLVSPNAIATAQLKVWHGAATHVAAFSDGLQMLALTMPGGTPYTPFFSPIFQFVTETRSDEDAQERLIAFLQSGRVLERTDDDLTLLLASTLTGG